VPALLSSISSRVKTLSATPPLSLHTPYAVIGASLLRSENGGALPAAERIQMRTNYYVSTTDVGRAKG